VKVARREAKGSGMVDQHTAIVRFNPVCLLVATAAWIAACSSDDKQAQPDGSGVVT